MGLWAAQEVRCPPVGRDLLFGGSTCGDLEALMEIWLIGAPCGGRQKAWNLTFSRRVWQRKSSGDSKLSL